LATYPITRPAEPRGWLATFAVLVVMVGILVTGVVVEGAVADAPDRPIEVSDGVTVTPLPDWEFGGRSDDERTILLSKGLGSVAITVADGTDVAGALNAVRNEWLASGTVTATEVGPVTSARPGATAIGFAYSGTFPDLAGAVEGEVTGYTGTSITVAFDGWADLGDYRGISDEIAEMIRTAVIP